MVSIFSASEPASLTMKNVDSVVFGLFALFLGRWGQAEFVPSLIAVVSEPLLTSD